MIWYIDNQSTVLSFNNPMVFDGEDESRYLVKFNHHNDMRIGINELVCGLIGISLELPVSEPIIAVVSPDIIESNDKLDGLVAGKHFASKYLEPFDTLHIMKQQNREPTAEMIGNIRMVPEFVIFDKYIENFDRHAGNICLMSNPSIGHKLDYFLFDHDRAFQRKEAIFDISGLRDLGIKLLDMHFITECIKTNRDFARIKNKIDRLHDSIPHIIGQIPAEWSNNHPDYIHQVEVLLTGFTDRIADRHINDNKMLFPNLV